MVCIFPKSSRCYNRRSTDNARSSVRCEYGNGIGEVDDVYQARHAIQDFDNTKAYYAVYGEVLYVLNNSTYTAATTETTYTYQWIEILPDDVVTTAELEATVMDKLLPYISASRQAETTR